MQLTVVIPVYNSERTIEPLVERLQMCMAGRHFEVILVNDGSKDRSEQVGQQLVGRYNNVRFISLRRNFGEFNAVLCGLNHAQGDYTAIIDDDFQNPPESILTLLTAAEQGNYDVVYSRYAHKQHHWFRNLGSWLVNTLTTHSLGKPRNLYLSSFKLIKQEVVAEICKYMGPYPYIDGLIFRVTHNIGSVEVPHQSRVEGQSNYTLKKLVGLFLTVFIGYSLWPVRLFTMLGISLFSIGLLLGVVGLISILASSIKLSGWVMVSWSILIATGLLLSFLGVLGEYLGKLFMAYSGLPPYVVKQNMSRSATVSDNQLQHTQTEPKS